MKNERVLKDSIEAREFKRMFWSKHLGWCS